MGDSSQCSIRRSMRHGFEAKDPATAHKPLNPPLGRRALQSHRPVAKHRVRPRNQRSGRNLEPNQRRLATRISRFGRRQLVGKAARGAPLYSSPASCAAVVDPDDPRLGPLPLPTYWPVSDAEIGAPHRRAGRVLVYHRPGTAPGATRNARRLIVGQSLGEVSGRKQPSEAAAAERQKGSGVGGRTFRPAQTLADSGFRSSQWSARGHMAANRQGVSPRRA